MFRRRRRDDHRWRSWRNGDGGLSSPAGVDHFSATGRPALVSVRRDGKIRARIYWPARRARFEASRWPSGRRLEKKTGTRRSTGRKSRDKSPGPSALRRTGSSGTLRIARYRPAGMREELPVVGEAGDDAGFVFRTGARKVRSAFSGQTHRSGLVRSCLPRGRRQRGRSSPSPG